MADKIQKQSREEQAPVLGEDKAQPAEARDKASKSDTEGEDKKAIDLPLEENQFNSQPG